MLIVELAISMDYISIKSRLAAIAFGYRSNWSISPEIGWSVSSGIGGQFKPKSGGQFLRNFHINGLNQLIAKLPNAHFFPFERFADRLNKNLKTLMTVAYDIAPLEEVVGKADQILADKGAKTVLAG